MNRLMSAAVNALAAGPAGAVRLAPSGALLVNAPGQPRPSRRSIWAIALNGAYMPLRCGHAAAIVGQSLDLL